MRALISVRALSAALRLTSGQSGQKAPNSRGTSSLQGTPGVSIPRRLLAALVAGSVLSCSDPVAVTRGVGTIVQERRTLRAIDSVEVSGGIDLSIQVRGRRPQGATGPKLDPLGPDTLVWIDAPEDLIALVVIEVHGSTLHVGPKDGARLDPIPTIEVFTSQLVSVAAEGAGEIRLVLDLPDGEVLPRLSLASKGAVEFQATGRVERLTVDQSGAGEMHLADLHTEALEVQSSGTGDVWAHASKSARVTLRGVCDLYLTGAATVEELQQIGAGKVIREP